MGYVLIAGGFDAAIPLTRMRIFLDTAEGRIWTDMDEIRFLASFRF